VVAAALAEKEAALAGDSAGGGTSAATMPTAAAALNEDFVTLKGLKPIKTPAPVVKSKVGRPSLGPSHMSAEESSSSEEDGEGAPGPQGYSIAKRNAARSKTPVS
jgi:hypothetical protein